MSDAERESERREGEMGVRAITPDEAQESWLAWLRDHPKPKKQRSRSPRARAVFDRDGHVCRQCGSTERLTVDHIKPRSKGGKGNLGNLQTLCEPCNQAKGDSYEDELPPYRYVD